MHLTPVAQFVVPGHGRVSAHGAGISRFADDAACRDYLVRLRWPEGFRCPKCRGADHWVTARGLRHCRGCGRQTSVTAGTLFADTHLPLRLWFEALWHVTSQKSGASALGLQRVLGLGSYCCRRCKSALFWRHCTVSREASPL